MIYLIGSLRNPSVPVVARAMRQRGFMVFDDWYAAGPKADDHWQEYEQAKGISYQHALRGYAAQHVFNFDKYHLNRADAGVLLYPAGRSCHLELGYLVGQGKPGFILLDKEPDRWDVMGAFSRVVLSVDELLEALCEHR